MSAQSTRIWENDSSPSSANNSKPAQLPSIATLTNEIPHGGNNSPTSAGYPTNRSSDQWNTPPQSTRKYQFQCSLPVEIIQLSLSGHCPYSAVIILNFSSKLHIRPLLIFYQVLLHILLGLMAITTLLQSALLIVPRIPASLEQPHTLSNTIRLKALALKRPLALPRLRIV